MFLSNLQPTSNGSNSQLGISAHKRRPKPQKKLTKMSQSVRCEICDIYCTSIELYEKHMAGKKHMKTLKKKYAPLTTTAQPTSQTVFNGSTLGLIQFVTESSSQGATSTPMGKDHLAGKRHRNQGVAITTMNEHGIERASSRAVDEDEDLDPKKQKVMESGVVEASVHACSSGDPGCKSDVPYSDHIAGVRHILQGVAITTMNEHGIERASSRAVDEDEDLDAKKQKVMESGVVETSVHACSSGDPGCKSDIPSSDHIAGVKHILQGVSPSVMGGHNNNEAVSVPPGEKLGTKKQKLIQSGVAAGSMRVCTACNIVCNSEVVFADHIAGKKHIAQMQKAAGIALVGGVPAAVAGARACGVCNIVCNSDSVFNSHLAGQKHASMVRKMAQTQTSISPTTTTATATSTE